MAREKGTFYIFKAWKEDTTDHITCLTRGQLRLTFLSETGPSEWE